MWGDGFAADDGPSFTRSVMLTCPSVASMIAAMVLRLGITVPSRTRMIVLGLTAHFSARQAKLIEFLVRNFSKSIWLSFRDLERFATIFASDGNFSSKTLHAVENGEHE